MSINRSINDGVLNYYKVLKFVRINKDNEIEYD